MVDRAGLEVSFTVQEGLEAIASTNPLATAETAVGFATEQFAERTASSVNMLFDDLEQQMTEWVRSGRISTVSGEAALSDAVGLMDQQIADSSGPFRQFFQGVDQNADQFGGQARAYQRINAEAEAAGIDWDAATGDTSPYVWITAGGNVCQDCIVRHGMKATYEEFIQLGLPKSGFSVCDTHCQCEVVGLYKLRQEGVTLNDVRRPVVSFQKDLAKGGTKTGLKIKDIGAVINGKGEGKVLKAFEKIEGKTGLKLKESNLQQRRMIRELGKFKAPQNLSDIRALGRTPTAEELARFNK